MILSCLNMIQKNLRISQADNINATIMGGEMGMEYALTPYWKADASLAYAWGKIPVITGHCRKFHHLRRG